ncbi:hypothetical protein CU097_002769 [Rhizopus azygosporus]|uniref:Uncharacterized protein n=1 Tax=Rhizopus azygosporus TaxID=86630 RepID=A0A367ISL9_RHIAZ|nr:hypothetical protein CU097_002769 [Rhizopus azygosporus]
MEITNKMASADSKQMGPMHHRRFCSPSNSSGRISADLAKAGPLPSTSLEINSKSTSHVQSPESTGHHTYDTVLEDSILIPNDSNTDERASLDHTNQQEMEPDRLEIIKTFNTQDGIDELTNRFLQQSHCKETHQLYNRGWSLWTSWCKKQQSATNNLQYEPKNILKFLVQRSIIHINT